MELQGAMLQDTILQDNLQFKAHASPAILNLTFRHKDIFVTAVTFDRVTKGLISNAVAASALIARKRLAKVAVADGSAISAVMDVNNDEDHRTYAALTEDATVASRLPTIDEQEEIAATPPTNYGCDGSESASAMNLPDDHSKAVLPLHITNLTSGSRLEDCSQSEWRFTVDQQFMENTPSTGAINAMGVPVDADQLRTEPVIEAVITVPGDIGGEKFNSDDFLSMQTQIPLVSHDNAAGVPISDIHDSISER